MLGCVYGLGPWKTRIRVLGTAVDVSKTITVLHSHLRRSGVEVHVGPDAHPAAIRGKVRVAGVSVCDINDRGAVSENDLELLSS